MRTNKGHPDRAALYRLLLDHDMRLRQYVDRQLPADVRNTLPPEEVMQEIWISVFRDIPSFHPNDLDRLDHRLRLIAMRTVPRTVRVARAINRHEGLQFLRIHSDSRSFDGTLLDGIEAKGRTPSREAAAREIEKVVQEVVARLPAEWRQAVRMRYIDGQSLEEIAMVMGRSRASIRSLLYRSKRQMRLLLGSARRYFSDTPSTGL